jgi:hypothetical protein
VDAAYWEFTTIVNGVRCHTTDVLFFDPSHNGVAILTRAPDTDYLRWSTTFDDILASTSLS